MVRSNRRSLESLWRLRTLSSSRVPTQHFADPRSANDRFPGQGIPLVSDIVIYFDLVQGLCNSTVNIETRLNNNLETYIQLLQLSGTASQNGIQYAEFDFTFTEDFTTGAGENPGPYSRAH